MKTVRQMRLVATKHDEKGLDARELPRLQRWEKCFLLTSPFIEREGAGCQRTTSPSAMGEVFSLDIPFYRTRPGTRPVFVGNGMQGGPHASLGFRCLNVL
jgi:hypothetical protein